jgi:hypothetical protein
MPGLRCQGTSRQILGSSSIALCQRSMHLSAPEHHLYGGDRGQLDSMRKLGICVLWQADLGIQPAEAEVTVCHEWPHAEFHSLRGRGDYGMTLSPVRRENERLSLSRWERAQVREVGGEGLRAHHAISAQATTQGAAAQSQQARGPCHIPPSLTQGPGDAPALIQRCRGVSPGSASAGTRG